MGQYTDSIVQFLQYAVTVLPELRRRNLLITSQSTCPAQIRKNETLDAQTYQSPSSSGSSLMCSGFFALHPAVDRGNTMTFVLSLYNLSHALEEYRTGMEINGESELRRLYGCLSSAVDPSRNKSCFFGNPPRLPGNHPGEASHPPCMSDQCRLQLAIMPSFSLVSAKLKKYIQLYIDFHTYGNLPGEHRMEALHTWSEGYLKRYRGISFLEFCAASGSLLGIVAMYASAANPGLTAQELALLDEACFPWLCGLESLLRAFVRSREAGYPGSLDFLSPYQNLKEFEQRLIFFLKQTETAFSRLRESTFYLSLLRTILGVYLSTPEAGFGLSRLASRNILKQGPRQSVFYCNGYKFLRFCRAAIQAV